MVKLKHFLFCFVPAIAAFAMAQVASILMMVISAIHGAIYKSDASAGGLGSKLISYWTSPDFATGTMIVYALMILSTFSIWYYVSCQGVLRPQFRRIFRPWNLFGIILLVPGGQILCGYLVSLIAAIFPSWLEQYEKLIETAGLDGNVTALMFVYSVILAPLAEELIFRGVTLACGKRALPFAVANIIQALLFGVFHLNMIQGIYAFFLGLLLGYICEKGGIYSAILLHSLFNFWGTVISKYFIIGDSPLSLLFWLMVSVLLTISGFLLFHKGNRQNLEQKMEVDMKMETGNWT